MFGVFLDPSAGQLIAQFLYQADAAVSTARETREKEKLKNGAIELDPDPGRSSVNIFFLFPVQMQEVMFAYTCNILPTMDFATSLQSTLFTELPISRFHRHAGFYTGLITIAQKIAHRP